MIIAEVRTGGQSGADRAAFDAARARGVAISGWCPKGGWAEDLQEPPGLLIDYPEMIETPSSSTIQRTEWNIRDSSACLVFNVPDTSPGTDAGMRFFDDYDVPFFEIDLDGDFDIQLDEAISWLEEVGDGDDAFVLGVGGPRATEYGGVYNYVYDFVNCVLDAF